MKVGNGFRNQDAFRVNGEKDLMKKRTFFFALLVLSLIFLSLPDFNAWAQRPDSNAPEVTLNGGYLSEAGIGDNQGRMAIYSAGVTIKYWKLSFSYNHASFQWDDLGKIPFGNGRDEPWDILHGVNLGIRHNGVINDKWMYFLNGAVGSAFEEEMDFFTFRLGGGAVYKFSPSLSARLGAGFIVNKVDTRAIPIIGLAYRERAEDGFSVLVGFPKTEATYHFNEKLALSLAADFYRVAFTNLSEDSTVQSNGFASYDSIQAGLYLDFKPVDKFSVRVGLSHTLDNELKVYNDDGDEKGDYDVDGSLGGTIQLTYRF